MTTQQRRSEVVRARRSQRKSVTRSSRGARETGRQMPPMVSRTGLVAPPNTKNGHRSAANRRRVDVPLGSGSAELRLPGIALPTVGWRALSFVILAVFGLALFWMLTSPQFTVSAGQVTVNGLSRIDQDSLLAKTGILNRPVFLVDPGKLTKNLPIEVPALESVKISVSLGGSVTIDAVERVPVLTWDQADLKQVSWVDAQGRIFPALGSSDNLLYVLANDAPPTPPKLATIEDHQGISSSDATETPVPEVEEGKERLLEPELVQNLLALSHALPEGSTLVYDGTYGFGWEDPAYGWIAYFGKHLDQPELRLKIYTAVAAMFEEKQRKPVMISVEYINAPYYRMEP
jgi:cell division protein FtsQ